MSPPLVANPRWTADYEEKLRALIATREHNQLNRSENAIRNRMVKLALCSQRARRVPLAPSERLEPIRQCGLSNVRWLALMAKFSLIYNSQRPEKEHTQILEAWLHGAPG